MVTLILAMSACGGSSEVSEAELAFNDGVDAYHQGLYTEAISHYDKAIQLDPDFAKAYINRGNSNFQLGQYQTAITDYTKAIELDPDDALAYINRGITDIEKGQSETATTDFDKAAQLDPDFAQYYNLGLGVAYDYIHQYSLADR